MTDLFRTLAASGVEFDRWEIVFTERMEGFYLAVITGLVVAGVVSAISDYRAGGWKAFVLLGLRMAAIGTVAIAAAGPRVQLQKTQPIRNQLLVYVDESPSMGIPDAYGGNTRIESVASWISSGGLPLDSWKESYDVRILGFSGSGEEFRVSPLSPDTVQSGEVMLDGYSTDFSSLITDVSRRLKDQPASGVIIISDGADLSGLSETARRENLFSERLRQAGLPDTGVPVNTVLVGGEEPIPDISIASLDVDDYAFIRNQVQVTVHIRVNGIPGGDIPVFLKLRGGLLAQTRVKVPDSGVHQLQVKLSLVPEEVGEFVYEVSIPPVEIERIRDNNQKAFLLNVIRDRIRVLQVVGHPSWDVRFMRQLLKRDPNIDLISFMILRDYEQLRMMAFREDELSLIPFPTEEIFDRQLPSFDVVLMQNFQYRDYYGINRMHLENMRKFVAEKGGGLVFIGGDQGFSDKNFEWPPIADLMPFERFSGGSLLDMGKVYDERPFVPKLSATGKIHPMLRLVPDPGENEKLWARLTPLEGLNLTGPLKVDAFSLMDHPSLKYPDGRPMSVVAARQSGKGRVLGMASDASWFWAFPAAAAEGTARHYAAFWREALRWLTKDPSSQRVQVSTPRRQYRPGEEVRVRVNVLDEQYQPADDVSVTVTPRSVSQVTGNLCESGQIARSGPGIYEISCRAEGSGFISIVGSARAKNGQDLGSDTGYVEVLSPVAEYEQTRVDSDLMGALANRLGGRALRIEDGKTDGKPVIKPVDAFRVLGAREVDLWDNGLVLLILVAGLAIEWFLRRQWGLA